MQKEDKKSDSARDSVTWNIIHEEDRTFPSSGLQSKVIGKEYFSTKQQEMDMQLQTLQNITENMEEDFRNTKLVSSDCCCVWNSLFFNFFHLKTKFTFWNDVFSNLLSICWERSRIIYSSFTFSAAFIGWHGYLQWTKCWLEWWCS